MRVFLSILLSVLFVVNVHAQYKFEHYNASGSNTIEVIENNISLKMPFTGGFKLPQFSECDLDFDGKLDLVVFDKEGSRISTFLNKGAVGEINYQFAPEYIQYFPRIDNWLIMKDYNKDGKLDIFTSHPSGIKIYKNISSPQTGLQFQKVVDILQVNYKFIVSNLEVKPNDLPSIIDVDDDGDLDIIHFYSPEDSSGESVYWYENKGMDIYNSADSLTFYVGKQCWGRFRESALGCNININYPEGACGNGEKSIKTAKNKLQNPMYHPGSTTCVLDATGDGLYDILIGDVACKKITLLVNGASNQEAIMTQKVDAFPDHHPININNYPAVFNIDVNNDGLKDLIAVPFTLSESDNVKQVHLYVNNGSIGLNRFDFYTDEFLLNQTIDVGDGASPAFIDYNKDGLMDIVISNHQYAVNATYTTGLALYENKGTSTKPVYELISRDWLGLSTLNIKSMAPSFGDMDNDGDLDMVCGANDGTLHYFKNTANTGSNVHFEYQPNYFSGIDGGQHSSPFLFDFNNDKKLEIILGIKFNNIQLYENIGTIENPQYVLATDSLYKINLKNFSSYPSGRAHLQIQRILPDDVPRVILSNGNGKLYIMDEVSTDYHKRMQIAIDSLDLEAGQYSFYSGGYNFSMADIDNDHRPELMVGSPQGGLFMYKNIGVAVGIGTTKQAPKLKIYPNPTIDVVTIQLTNDEPMQTIKLFDINGRLLEERNVHSSSATINMEQYTKGLYLITAQTETQNLTHRFVFQGKE